MLQRDVRELRGTAAQGFQRHIDSRQQQPAFVSAALGDHADGGSGSHVNGDDGRLELLQRRHRVGHDIRTHLRLVCQPDVQACPNAGANHHRRSAQQTGQGFFHHKIQRGHDTAQDGAGYICITVMIQCKQVHQVNADLISGFAAVCIQRGQKAQVLILVKQPHGGRRIAHVDGQKHRACLLSPLYILVSMVSRLPVACKCWCGLLYW